ncbi:MAG: sulfide/dihydroorotate dehydrogenase-like FAD/NAD-binding protein, partial [Chloroflexi bacterium]|nr:sulfide/dihydroorotate dehydrogenase-like FAD/NAD-binding protein [Chloroflexota bacterium]
MRQLSPYTILKKEQLTATVFAYDVYAPRIAAKAKPGQFVIIRTDPQGERMPLTIAHVGNDYITIVFMRVGVSTEKLTYLEKGTNILDMAGPLGEPSKIKNFGTVVCVAGGFAVAPIVPIAKALKEAGNRVVSILGARNKDLLFWQEEFGQYSDELIIMTDDGSMGRKGLVTEPLKEL